MFHVCINSVCSIVPLRIAALRGVPVDTRFVNDEAVMLGDKNKETTCTTEKVKVKCTLVQALRLCTGRTAHTDSRGIALLFHDHGTRRGWEVSVKPRPLFTPGGKTQHPLYSGPRGRSRQARKISPPPGFDPRTVQSVASRYTDYATPVQRSPPLICLIYCYPHVSSNINDPTQQHKP